MVSLDIGLGIRILKLVPLQEERRIALPLDHWNLDWVRDVVDVVGWVDRFEVHGRRDRDSRIIPGPIDLVILLVALSIG